MNAKAVLLTSLAGLVLSLAACGGDGNHEAAPGANGSQPDSSQGGAMVVPGQYLEYDGRKYELIDVIGSGIVDEADFSEIGEATSVAIDSSGTTVFERDGDASNVYTFEDVIGEGSEAAPANWLKWRPVS